MMQILGQLKTIDGDNSLQDSWIQILLTLDSRIGEEAEKYLSLLLSYRILELEIADFMEKSKRNIIQENEKEENEDEEEEESLHNQTENNIHNETQTDISDFALTNKNNLSNLEVNNLSNLVAENENLHYNNIG